MNKGQFIGALVDAGFWVAFGVFVQFYAPKYIQKRIEQGKETPDKAARFKKNGKWIGWLLIAFGVIKLVGVFLGQT
jgi:hypothetical protein